MGSSFITKFLLALLSVFWNLNSTACAYINTKTTVNPDARIKDRKLESCEISDTDPSKFILIVCINHNTDWSSIQNFYFDFTSIMQASF